jgi:hypothetical protein
MLVEQLRMLFPDWHQSVVEGINNIVIRIDSRTVEFTNMGKDWLGQDIFHFSGQQRGIHILMFYPKTPPLPNHVYGLKDCEWVFWNSTLPEAARVGYAASQAFRLTRDLMAKLLGIA